MVPQSWILVSVAANLITFIEKSMAHWKTTLTAGGKTPHDINTTRGIFQGDSLPPLLFVIAMIPMTSLLRHHKAGYSLDGNRLNHLQPPSITFNHYSSWTTWSCAVRVREKWNLCYKQSGCSLRTWEWNWELRSAPLSAWGEESYSTHRCSLVDREDHCRTIPLKDRITSISDYHKLTISGNGEMNAKVKKEYAARVRKILQSKLNGGNTIAAINTWATALARYLAAISNRTKEELFSMDRHTRKLLTMHEVLHPYIYI